MHLVESVTRLEYKILAKEGEKDVKIFIKGLGKELCGITNYRN